MSENKVDLHEANVLADQVMCGRIEFGDAAHRLFQYWETRLTPDQATHKLQRCVDAMTERAGGAHWP